MKPRGLLIWARNRALRFFSGVEIDLSVSSSLSSRFVSRRRGSIVVGPDTLIAFKTLICAYDVLSGEVRPVRIGRDCFIGGASVILPGVTIGDGSIVGGGAVVYDDVPPGTIVGGNPARVLRRDIEVGPYGRLKSAAVTAQRLWAAE